MKFFKLSSAALFAMFPSLVSAQSVAPSLAPGEVLLQVEAQGEFLSRPDLMTITAGVLTEGKTAADALNTNKILANRMLEVVQASGVASTDVKTSELSVEPVRAPEDDRGSQTRTIIGYLAANKVELRLRDLARAPAIVDALYKAGANSVQGPVFGLSNPKPAQMQARRAAVAAAREEAQTYAEAFGMKIVRIVRASERGDFRYEGTDQIVVTGTSIPRTRVEPGELTTSIDLWVDYALVPK